MLTEFSILPVGTGESLGDCIADVLKIVDGSGFPYRANSMGTVVEGGWDEVMALVKECHEAALKKAPRVFVNITMDVRPSKPAGRITGKLESVEKRLGAKLNR